MDMFPYAERSNAKDFLVNAESSLNSSLRIS
jgi:hypothetical protein